MQLHARIIHHDELAVAFNHWPLLGKIQRHNRDILARDILPDVQLRPIGKREHADAFAFVFAGVIEVPQFRALLFGIPAVLGIAERKNTLLGAGFFFIATCATKGGIETIFIQRLFQPIGLHHLRMQC